MEIEVNSLDELLYSGLKKLENAPEVDSRLGDKTKEILGMKFILKNPCNRYMLSKTRKHNIFHQIFESLWVLTGHTKLSHLARFLPNCKDFSDNWNGTEGTWRSQYGQRLRWWQDDNVGPLEYCAPDNYVDQWRNVVEELKNHPNTRQAVMTIWDPKVDGNFKVTVKDRACNNWIQFILRNNKLHMFVTQRSSDGIWGLSAINVPEFTFMQELTVSVLGCEVGTYNHVIGSFHIYDRHYERMNEIINEYESGFNFLEVGDGISENSQYLFEKIESFDKLDNLLNSIYNMEIKLRDLDTDKFDKEYFEYYMSLINKYPNIGATFSIPLIYKRDFLNNKYISDIVNFINSANLNPSLKKIFDNRLNKMLESRSV